MTANHPRWCESDHNGAHTRHVGLGEVLQVEIRQVRGGEPRISIIDAEASDEYNLLDLTAAQAAALAYLLGIDGGLTTDSIRMENLISLASEHITGEVNPDEVPGYVKAIGGHTLPRSLFRRFTGAVKAVAF